MTELRLAQYEAELYIEALHAPNNRRVEAWANLGGALAGAALIALAATSDMTGAARGRYRAEQPNGSLARLSVVPVLVPGRALLVLRSNF